VNIQQAILSGRPFKRFGENDSEYLIVNEEGRIVLLAYEENPDLFGGDDSLSFKASDMLTEDLEIMK
jgi:hypothetical protein